MSAGAKAAILPSPFLSLSSESPRWVTAACILSSDVLTLMLLFAGAVTVRHLLTPSYRLSSYVEMFPCIALLIATFWSQGLYPGALLHPAEEMRRTFTAITLVFLLIASASFLWRTAEAYSRAVFLVTWVAGTPLVLCGRLLVRSIFANEPWWGVSAILLGSGPAAQRVARGLRRANRGLRIVGVLSSESAHPWAEDLPPLIGSVEYAPAIAASGIARYAIIAIPGKSSLELSKTIQDHCAGFTHVLFIPNLPGLCSLEMSAREVGGEVGFELPQRLCDRGAAFTKRAADIVCSAGALLFLLPLFLLIAAAIKLSSPGPVLFGHTRRGRGGAAFKALKFRTMVPHASRVLEEHLATHPGDRAEWQRDRKLKNDPRITRVGRWLRRCSLDELPQLLNVFVGEMSLVGPRPIVEDEIAKYGSGYDLYTRVRPGITGLWQVSGRNNTTYKERVAYDEYYVRNWSVWIDYYILIRTIKVVFTAEGAY